LEKEFLDHASASVDTDSASWKPVEICFDEILEEFSEAPKIGCLRWLRPKGKYLANCKLHVPNLWAMRCDLVH
jgi:hypothetical protein